MIYGFALLLGITIYVTIRYCLLRKQIRSTIYHLESINNFKESNTRLILDHPDKIVEQLLSKMNNYIEESHQARIKSEYREEAIRKEIEHISHDLRTPLTSLRGYLELMGDENSTEQEKRDYHSVVERKAKGLHALIENFYDYSVLESTQAQLHLESININKVLRELLLLYYNDFEKQHIDVTIELLDEPVMILSDLNSIKRILSNMIQNAVKYSEHCFTVSLEIVNDRVLIQMSNDMVAISQEESNQLFDRFYMVDKTRNNESSGLGLTVTKYLVELLEGSITANVKGDHITFELYLEK